MAAPPKPGESQSASASGTEGNGVAGGTPGGTTQTLSRPTWITAQQRGSTSASGSRASSPDVKTGGAPSQPGSVPNIPMIRLKIPALNGSAATGVGGLTQQASKQAPQEASRQTPQQVGKGHAAAPSSSQSGASTTWPKEKLLQVWNASLSRLAAEGKFKYGLDKKVPDLPLIARAAIESSAKELSIPKSVYQLVYADVLSRGLTAENAMEAMWAHLEMVKKELAAQKTAVSKNVPYPATSSKTNPKGGSKDIQPATTLLFASQIASAPNRTPTTSAALPTTLTAAPQSRPGFGQPGAAPPSAGDIVPPSNPPDHRNTVSVSAPGKYQMTFARQSSTPAKDSHVPQLSTAQGTMQSRPIPIRASAPPVALQHQLPGQPLPLPQASPRMGYFHQMPGVALQTAHPPSATGGSSEQSNTGKASNSQSNSVQFDPNAHGQQRPFGAGEDKQQSPPTQSSLERRPSHLHMANDLQRSSSQVSPVILPKDLSPTTADKILSRPVNARTVPAPVAENYPRQLNINPNLMSPTRLTPAQGSGPGPSAHTAPVLASQSPDADSMNVHQVLARSSRDLDALLNQIRLIHTTSANTIIDAYQYDLKADFDAVTLERQQTEHNGRLAADANQQLGTQLDDERKARVLVERRYQELEKTSQQNLRSAQLETERERVSGTAADSRAKTAALAYGRLQKLFQNLSAEKVTATDLTSSQASTIVQLKLDIDNLGQTIKNLTKAAEELREEEQEAKLLSSAPDDAKASSIRIEVAGLKESLQRAECSLVACMAELNGVENRCRRALDDRSSSVEFSLQISAELKKVSHELLQVKAKLVSASEQLEARDKELSAAHATIAELRMKCDSLTVEMAEANQRCDAKSAEITRILGLQQRIQSDHEQTLARERAEFVTKLEEAGEENGRLIKAQQDGWAAEKRVLEKRMSELEGEVLHLRQQIAETPETSDTASAHITSLRERLELAIATVSAGEETAQELAAVWGEAEAQLQREAEELRSQLTAKEAAFKAAEDTVAEQSAKVAELEEQVAKLQAKVDAESRTAAATENSAASTSSTPMKADSSAFGEASAKPMAPPKGSHMRAERIPSQSQNGRAGVSKPADPPVSRSPSVAAKRRRSAPASIDSQTRIKRPRMTMDSSRQSSIAVDDQGTVAEFSDERRDDLRNWTLSNLSKGYNLDPYLCKICYTVKKRETESANNAILTRGGKPSELLPRVDISHLTLFPEDSTPDVLADHLLEKHGRIMMELRNRAEKVSTEH